MTTQTALVPLLVKPKWYQIVKEGGSNLGSKEKVDPHKHIWKKYKQTIRPDNPNFKRGSEVYMVVLVCECTERSYVSLCISS